MSIVPQHMIDALEAVYAKLPTMQCKGMCQTCCGPIDMSLAERMRIEERGVRIPPMTETRVALWDANHKFDPATGEPLFCPALNLETGGCNVYDVRPIVCRLWGTSASMPCPHGCETTKMLTDAEAMAFMMEAMQAGGGSMAGEFDDDEERLMQVAMTDEVCAPLMAKFLRGDKSVHEEILREIERIKGEIGIA